MISGQVASANEAFSQALDNQDIPEAHRLLSSALSRLMQIPAVMNFDSNVALRHAASHGHFDVINRLLAFPEIAASIAVEANEALRWAMQNGDYDIAGAEEHLATIAQDDESSIRNLSSAEMEELSTLKKRYAEQFQQQGLEAILNGLHKHLVAKYSENPPQYKGRPLSLEHDDKLDKEANALYYKNPYHTAYRYLFCKPNPWIAPGADWVRTNAQGAWANISDATKENIAYLWLAASDKALPLPFGYTSEDIQNQFVDLLSDAGRGHNWDKKRKKTILKNQGLTEIEEAFDDGEGDKPSCSLGVTRRTVAQFLLLLQPEVKPLNKEAIHARFMEKMVTQNPEKNGLFDKIMALDLIKLTALDLALKNLVVIAAANIQHLDKAEQDLLKEVLSVDAPAMKAFMEECYRDFGKRLGAKANLQWEGVAFDSYEKLIQHFTKNTFTIFYNAIKKKCEEQLRLLTPKKPADAVALQAPAPICIPKPAAAPLIFTPKKQRRERPSEVVKLLKPFLESGLRRSPRLQAQQAEESGIGKRRCCRKKPSIGKF